MATRKELYGKIFEKLGDIFKKSGSWATLPPEVKAAAKKDPKIRKKIEDLEDRAKKMKKSLDALSDML